MEKNVIVADVKRPNENQHIMIALYSGDMKETHTVFRFDGESLTDIGEIVIRLK